MLVTESRPRLRLEDACALAQKHYGLQAAAHPFPSDRDQNFHLVTPSGHYVLKVASADEQRAVLEVQNQVMRHLAACGLNVPVPQRNTDGDYIGTLEGEAGQTHLVRLLTYVEGRPLAKINPQQPALLYDLGAFLGRMDAALASFDHPGAYRDLSWDFKHAPDVLGSYAAHVTDAAQQVLLAHYRARFEAELFPRLSALRQGVIHNDANDYNILVRGRGLAPRHVEGVIDFGDLVHSYTIGELAIAAAYVMMDKGDPLTAAAAVVKGYHASYPLEADELDVLFDLILLRLCISVVTSAYQKQLEPDNTYLTISERPAWALLERLRAVHPRMARAVFREACGLAPWPTHERVVQWLQHHGATAAPVVAEDLRTAPCAIFDLSVASPDLAATHGGADVQAITMRFGAQLMASGGRVGVGRYDEARGVYTAPQFREETEIGTLWRTIHIGMDLFMEAGTPVFAPFEGTLHSFKNNAAHLDYGPTIVLRHDVGAGVTFFTLYGHLSMASLEGLYPGKAIGKGEQIGTLGRMEENGGWIPHLHFQVMVDDLDCEADFAGVAPARRRALWRALCPDPNLILGIPADRFPPAPLPPADIVAARKKHLGPSLSLSYRTPLHIVMGRGAYLYDAEGRAYLDGVNNVCHVGHAHPRVVEAAQQQMAVLNTNTRYLHENLVRYAARLTATLPPPLEVCFFVNSGSEANDLALRLARAATGRRSVLVVDGAYHGNLSSLVEISPYKYDGPGGEGPGPHVHEVDMPDPYRGPYLGHEVATGARYAEDVAAVVASAGGGVGAFIAESILSCGGQVVLPPGYLKAVYGTVRAAGGVCIADEVQVGFGRVGSHFWAFETQGVVPDIVTMGKPIGNGHPMGAVVTTRAIAEAFHNGMEYFNTYGGNPVSCAVGLAVLDVIEAEGLQAHAASVGGHLLEGLRGCMDRHALIGEVRGMGLFLGIELVRDRETKAPAAAAASYVVNRMKDFGILLSTDGPLHNVIKMKPPLVFSREDADRLLGTLDKVLQEDPLQTMGAS